ncbi:hypothetical protein ACIQPR_48840 [Streptomyces sp. NPDC091280]|uniref:hypothetical protein n=1 Tax=Streptomyces sp. NPDC091280 TaxID=3365984 RepID=UPI003806F4E2
MPVTAVEETIRTTPIRVTVDISPALHKALKRWCNGAALDLDLTDVALAGAARALVAELTEPDPTKQLPGLEERVRARLKAGDYTHTAPTQAQAGSAAPRSRRRRTARTEAQ